MAYKTKFLHFKTKASYRTEREKTIEGSEDRNVFDAYISFIDEGPTICTFGKEYKCDISASEVEEMINTEQVSPATIIPIIAGTGTIGTSIKYAREDHIHPAQTTVSGNAGTATKLQTARTISISGAISGSTTFDGSDNVSINSTLNNIDANKITSGTISIDRLPKGALERLVIVANSSARFNLTTADVQEGDTVKQTDTGVMYFVIDSTKLNSEAGYSIYTAGSATSVPWSGITDKPTFATVATSGKYSDLSGLPTIPTQTSQLTNNSGFLTSVPVATSSVNGGIKIGYTASGKNYPVVLDSSSKAYVNVPWTDTNTTYSAGTGITFSGTTINNSGVRSIGEGTTNGTISVNTNGTSANVAVKGLGSAAYTASTAYAAASHTHSYLPLSGGALTGAVTSTSTFTATNFITSSDKRLKDNIVRVTTPTNSLSLDTYSFKYKSSGRISYGHIAQEVQESFPELVSTDQNGYLAIDYTGLHSLQIKELKNEINELRSIIKSMRDGNIIS